ncbi:hypothetical protein J6590_028962 [Homalodisca vitripennis]|nr:hypothetical protein J6590_028962 [Homalodisca vitripennis]
MSIVSFTVSVSQLWSSLPDMIRFSDRFVAEVRAFLLPTRRSDGRWFLWSHLGEVVVFVHLLSARRSVTSVPATGRLSAGTVLDGRGNYFRQSNISLVNDTILSNYFHVKLDLLRQKLMSSLIEATILITRRTGGDRLLQRISIIPTDAALQCRRQP